MERKRLGFLSRVVITASVWLNSMPYTEIFCLISMNLGDIPFFLRLLRCIEDPAASVQSA
jgi:hypothetical protein